MPSPGRATNDPPLHDPEGIVPTVHWHEGQFLQPHHFQALQRQAPLLIAGERAWSIPFGYGVSELAISADALANGRVEVRRLRAILRGGRVVDVPGTTELPAMSLAGKFDPAGKHAKGMLVSLAVPTRHADRANTVGAMAVDEEADDDEEALPEFDDGAAELLDTDEEAEQQRRAYRVRRLRMADENTGDNPQPVLLRRLNARLIADGDDASDLETLPLLRVVAGKNAVPTEDAGYVPPSLTIGACERLRTLVRELADLVEASRSALSRQMTNDAFSFETIRGAQFEQQVRLRTLNRAAVTLRTLAAVPNTPPLTAWLALRELLAELAARFPSRTELWDGVPDFDHDNLAYAFAGVEERLRPLLSEETKSTFRKIDFKLDTASDVPAYVASLDGRDIKEPDDFFLGVTVGEGGQKLAPDQLAALVGDASRFKVMSGRYRNQAVYGVRLEEERRPPVALPPETGLSYFRLKRFDENKRPKRMWQEICKERVIAIRYPDMDQLKLKLSLFLTLQDGVGGGSGGSGGSGGGGAGEVEVEAVKTEAVPAPRSAPTAPRRPAPPPDLDTGDEADDPFASPGGGAG